MLLRRAGITKAICLMEGLFHANELPQAITQDFSLIVHHLQQVEMLEQYQDASHPITVWLKIDTGMHRLGFKPVDAPAAYQRLLNCPLIKKPIGLMTHFANADAKFLTLQLQTFLARAACQIPRASLPGQVPTLNGYALALCCMARHLCAAIEVSNTTYIR
jgi:alanine racemase